MMRVGLFVSTIGEHADPRLLAELAREAEDAGWDGFFLWDVLLYIARPGEPVVDSWITLAAIAMVTERIRLGPMVTPVARRRPWKLAREAVTLDHLSNGRLTIGVGLGDTPEIEFARYGEDPDNRVRAAKLDEGLAIMAGLWSGQPFSFQGEYYTVAETVYAPPPVQQPRIPIWVVGGWPRKGPMRRAARWDGVFPYAVSGSLEPADLAEVRAFIDAERASDGPYDVVVSGNASGTNDPTGRLAAWREAGATWWLEDFREREDSAARLRALIRNGPPRP